MEAGRRWRPGCCRTVQTLVTANTCQHSVQFFLNNKTEDVFSLDYNFYTQTEVLHRIWSQMRRGSVVAFSRALHLVSRPVVYGQKLIKSVSYQMCDDKMFVRSLHLHPKLNVHEETNRMLAFMASVVNQLGARDQPLVSGSNSCFCGSCQQSGKRL